MINFQMIRKGVTRSEIILAETQGSQNKSRQLAPKGYLVWAATFVKADV